MSLIIVGNGPSLLDSENGNLIDNFDIVVRLNAYTIKGFEKYVGTTTHYYFNTINFTNKNEQERLKHEYKRFVWHSWNWNAEKDESYKDFLKFYEGKSTEVIKTSRDTILEIQEYVGDNEYFTYSTGAIAIWMLLKEIPELYITGFDWWNKNDKHHYNDSGKLGNIHKPESEFRFINKLRIDNRIHFL